MDSRTGKKIRMGRIFRPSSGRTIIVAYSHASFMGAMPGMRTADEMLQVSRALQRAEAIMVAPGEVLLLEDAFIGKDRPSLVVQVDWQSYSRKVLPYEMGAAAAMSTIDQAAAAGADAVMSYLYLGHPDPEVEKQEIARNAKWVRQCDRHGLLLMIEPRSAVEKTDPARKLDPEMMSLYARISAEIGADIVKVIDPGNDDALAKIAEECPAPVVLAGGAQKGSFDDALTRAEAAVQAGWAGVVYGRNLFQHENPAQALDRLIRIVHGDHE